MKPLLIPPWMQGSTLLLLRTWLPLTSWRHESSSPPVSLLWYHPSVEEKCCFIAAGYGWKPRLLMWSPLILCSGDGELGTTGQYEHPGSLLSLLWHHPAEGWDATLWTSEGRGIDSAIALAGIGERRIIGFSVAFGWSWAVFVYKLPSWAVIFLVLWLKRASFHWNLKKKSVLISISGLLLSLALGLGYMRWDKKKIQGTNHHVVPQVSSSPADLPSYLYFSEFSDVCSMYYV